MYDDAKNRKKHHNIKTRRISTKTFATQNNIVQYIASFVIKYLSTKIEIFVKYLNGFLLNNVQTGWLKVF